jgi:RNA polymerase sigma-70 factor (ECF subfamily)
VSRTHDDPPVHIDPPAPDAAERALVERLRRGDKVACAECVALHSAGLYRLALRLMRNENDAEDVLQETLLNAFRAMRSFDGRSSLKTWLYRIAYNTALMRLRRTNPVIVPVDASEDESEGHQVPRELFDWCCLPERDFESAAARAELEHAIGELTEKLRVVFVLRELEDLSTEETAHALEISEQVVKTRLHRARLWLRKRLSGYFSDAVSPANKVPDAA